jgi:hypothetical protein
LGYSEKSGSGIVFPNSRQIATSGNARVPSYKALIEILSIMTCHVGRKSGKVRPGPLF